MRPERIQQKVRLSQSPETETDGGLLPVSIVLTERPRGVQKWDVNNMYQDNNCNMQEIKKEKKKAKKHEADTKEGDSDSSDGKKIKRNTILTTRTAREAQNRSKLAPLATENK